MEYWDDWETDNARALSVIFQNEDMSDWQLGYARSEFPYADMKGIKHHQWIILPRRYVEYLRTEDTAAHFLLAHAEHAQFPDEWFFASSVMRPGHPYSKKVINNSKRYISEFSGAHPIPITMRNLPKMEFLLSTKDFYLARKLDVLTQTEVVSWLDDVRNNRLVIHPTSLKADQS